MIPAFMEAVVKLDTGKLQKLGEVGRRKAASLRLATELQRLFGYLIKSNRRAVDTRRVTDEIVDDYGKPVKIHEQKDIGEFNINFLARIHDALELGKDNTCTKTPAALSPEAKKQFDRSVALGMSVLLPVSPDDLTKTFIYNTFFGSFQMVIKAKEKDGRPIELNTSTTFGQIIINASERDFYKGWQANYYTDIEDFQTASVLCWRTVGIYDKSKAGVLGGETASGALSANTETGV